MGAVLSAFTLAEFLNAFQHVVGVLGGKDHHAKMPVKSIGILFLALAASGFPGVPAMDSRFCCSDLSSLSA